MSLGYALLHRNRIQAALEAGPRKASYDDLADFGFGIMGAGDLGAALNEFARSRSQMFSDFIEQAQSPFTGPNGPFSFIQNLVNRLGSAEGAGQLSGELFTLLGQMSGPRLREQLRQWVDRLCAVIPELSGQALNRLLRDQVNDITAILEQPLRSGRRDVAAHRAFRAAVTMRQFISEGLDEAPWADAAFDLRGMLCQVLHQAIAEVDDEVISAFAQFTQSFQGEYGALLSASFSFSAGASVSVSTGGGPDGMPDPEPTFRDELKAVSHPEPGGIWGLDLATNILATFFLIWESVRTGNYADRAFDGFLSVITILWQVTHTIVRAAAAKEINRATDETDAGKIFVNWLFSDQGNFGLNLLLRLFQSFHDGGGSNWALSFAQRSLKYFTNVTIIRSIYYFARSAWYFTDRATNRTASDPDEVSLVRMLWAVWGPMSWLSAFFSFFTAWEHFTLEKGLGKARTIVLLVLALLLGLVGGYLTLGLLANESPFGLSVYADWWTMGLVFAVWILALIAMIIILADLESGSKGAAIAGFVVFAVLIIYGMIGLPFLFGEDNTAEHFFLGSFIIFSSIFAAGVLPFFLWWFYVDDGRDKHDLFEGKNPASSPYKLPYRAGENWLCGQGVHGIFSHYPSDLSNADDFDNHYAYDFNEKENKNSLAARPGIVVDLVKDNENGSDEANYVDVLHLDWAAGHDPGADQERVLTYATYYHLSKDRIYTDIGHRFVQGYHIADIDSTGRSAQHHLHFHVHEFQRRVWQNNWSSDEPRNVVVPIVFRDDSTRRFRNFPFLAWIPGGGHIPGKPLSMAYYTSENSEEGPLANPIVLSLEEAGATPHEHWLIIDRTALGSGPLPASLSLRTTVNQRHAHEITLNRAQLEQLVGMRVPTGLNVSTVNGHAHAIIGHKYLQPTVSILLSTAGKPEHVHWLHIDQRALGWEWGVIPATFNFTTTSFTDPSGASHDHQVTLDHQQLLDILRRRRIPPNLQVNTTNGHRHTLREVRRFPSQPEMTIVEPPRGQLLATTPAPYRLVGDQFVARVNERAIEYFFYGAQRPRLRGEIALDRGLSPADALNIGGTNYSVPAATTDFTARGVVEALNGVWRSGGLPVEARLEPVIVVETVQSGASASLQMDAASSAAFARHGVPTDPVVASGSGALGSVSQATPAQLAAQFDTIMKNGWPAPPGAIQAQVDGGNHLVLTLGGAAITFPNQNTRNSDILARLYDSSANRLRATGPIPLSSGRIHLTAGYSVPVLATSAQVQLDTSHAAFSGADLTATPLEIITRGRTVPIRLGAGEAAPAVLARKIALAVEGVRAWASGPNQVTLQTVAAGRSIHLEARKALASGPAFQAQNSGDAPALSVAAAGCAFTGGIDDSRALPPEQLCALIHDATARATLPYNAASVAPQARMDGNALVLEVAGGHTLSVTAVRFSGGHDPFNFSQNGPNQLRSTALASPVNLNGPGWVELEIDGQRVIVPFDGEAARLELGLQGRLPANGENLIMSVNGAGNSTLAFTGNERSVSAVATAIAQHFNDISVRLAYVLSFENALYDQPGHTLQLNDASGLALAGFLADRSGYQTTAISAGADHLALPANLTAPVRDHGLRVKTLTPTEQAAGANKSWSFNAQAGLTLHVTPTPADNPLPFSGNGTAALSIGPIPATVELKHQCQRYDFELRDAANTPITRSRLQIAAAPAIIRANNPFSAPLPADTTLPVTVVEPTSPTTTENRLFSVNLAGVTSLDQVVYQLNAEIPAIRAWVARSGGNSLLHLETQGYGKGWRLRLGNPLLLLALGFDETQIDLNAGHLEVAGGGDIRDGRGATQDEIRAAMQRVEKCATLLVRALGTPQSLQIDRDGTSSLVLRSQEGAVVIETEPPSLKSALHVAEAGGSATIAPPGPTVSLDCGSIIVKAGGRSVAAVRVFADHATVTADEALPGAGSAAETRQLTLLKTHAWTVNGSPVGPLDNAITSLEDALEWYAARIPGNVWIGVNGSNHVALQSRERGDTSLSLTVDFNNFSGETFAPGDTLLGFAVAPLTGGAQWQFSGNGQGNVARLEAIPVWSTAPGSLEDMLKTAAQHGAARQAVYEVEADSTAAPAKLRIRSTVATRQVQHVAPPAPGGLQFNSSGGGLGWDRILETNYSLTPPVRPGQITLQARDGGPGGLTRDVAALVSGAPARLLPLLFPTDVSRLNTKGFDLTIGRGVGSGANHTTFNVRFSNIASQQQAAAQVERQCRWQVRARVVSSALVIETVETGSAKTLSLNAPGGGVANAVTNNRGSGFRVDAPSPPPAPPLNAQGGGPLPEMDTITPEQYRDALRAGFISETTALDEARRGSRQLDWRAYEVRTAAPRYFTLTSQRNGCMSAVEPIVSEAPGLGLNDDLARAPAIHGSVALPLPQVNTLADDTFNLANAGALAIELNHNTKGTPPQSIEDLALRTVVEVAFTAGQYTAQEVARRIHEELFNRGAGQAAAYPDGSVVVETLVPGLAGSVTIPAPGTGSSANDQALLQALIGPAGQVRGRGWPGTGFGSPGDRLRPGFRGKKVTSAQAAATWVFRDGAASATVNVTSGQSLQDIQRAVDDALKVPTGGAARIGMCLVGPDDTLYIEGMSNAFSLEVTVGGRRLGVLDPGQNEPGKTPEREEEPALGLRRTHEIRTFRYARDRAGNGDGAQADDVGWVRIPAYVNTWPAATPANISNRRGTPARNLALPGGRFLMAARADAAKTRDYDQSGEMIASAGSAPGGGTANFVHRARYWIAFDDAQFMGIGKIVRTVEGNQVTDYLADLLWGG